MLWLSYQYVLVDMLLYVTFLKLLFVIDKLKNYYTFRRQGPRSKAPAGMSSSRCVPAQNSHCESVLFDDIRDVLDVHFVRYCIYVDDASRGDEKLN